MVQAIRRQKETGGAVALAFVAVLLYSLWGAHILALEHAAAERPSPVAAQTQPVSF